MCVGYVYVGGGVHDVIHDVIHDAIYNAIHNNTMCVSGMCMYVWGGGVHVYV